MSRPVIKFIGDFLANLAKCLQAVTKDGTYSSSGDGKFSMIDNYIYLYHTDTLIAIPTYPESISDSMAISYNSTPPLMRSAPIFSYASSGPRSVTISLNLHRDMMNEINTTTSRLNIAELKNIDTKDDYVDILCKQLQAAALPKYSDATKMVDPPIVAVRFGNDIFCKGVITGAVAINYSGPILRTDKYAQITIDFTINEIDPYDAESVMSLGSYRGMDSIVSQYHPK